MATQILTRPLRTNKTAGFLCMVIAWALIGAFHAHADKSDGAIDTSIITNISSFQQQRMAASELVIRIEAAATYFDPELKLFFAQDDSGAVQIDFPSDLTSLAVGDQIAIEGASLAQSDTNAILGLGDVAIWKTGSGKPPSALPVGAAGLLLPANNCRLVEVRGMVRSVVEQDKLQLVLVVEGKKCEVRIRQFKRADLDKLLDAQVVVQGVCHQTAGDHGVPSVVLWVQEFKMVRIEKPGPADPYAIELTTVKKLASEIRPESPGKRVRIAGRVQQQNLRYSLLMHDETGEILVETQQWTPLAMDDRIEVIGYPSISSGRKAVLTDAQFRVVEASKMPVVTSAQANASLQTLDTIEKVLALTRDQAQQNYPVKVQGIITHFDASRKLLFIQDDQHAIFIDPGSITADLKSGQKLEVTGVTVPGGILTMISAVKVIPLGNAVMPKAQPISWQQAMTAEYDCRRVRMKGAVQYFIEEEGHIQMEVAAPDGPFRCTITDAASLRFRTNLLNSIIQVEGVCMVHLNSLKLPNAIVIPVDRHEDIELLDKAPEDEFSLPAQRISNVLSFIPSNLANRRLKVAGIVTLYRPGRELYVQDATGGIHATTKLNTPLEINEEVELVGFRTVSDGVPMLQYSAFRAIGKGASPVPKKLHALALLSGKNKNELVQIEGRLMENAPVSAKPELVLESKQILFHASFETAGSGALSKNLRAGTILRITGVCRLLAKESDEFKSFQLLARSPADVEIVREPSWFTEERVGALKITIVAVSFATLFWIASLRRRVRKQTNLIRQRLERESSLEARCRELIEQANDIIFTHDSQGRFLDINRAGQRILGCSREEALQISFRQLVIPEHQHLLDEFIQNAGRSTAGGVIELEVLARDGRHVTLELSMRSIRTGQQVVGFESIARDVSERKRLETQLNQSQKMESIGQLAAGVAHDFNNILTVIQGHASLLLSFPGQSRDNSESLAQIAASAERAADLTRQLLAFSRKQIIQPRIIDLNEELGKMAKILERVLGEHIKLQVRCTSPLPTIKADPGMIGQVIMNLAVNARDAMKNGGLLEISTDAASTEKQPASPGMKPAYVKLTVRDTGCGMSREIMDHLFEPFFTTKEIGKGTGLGLSTVYGIVKQHDGLIEVSSKPDQGTAFDIFLPADGSPKEKSTSTEPIRKGDGTAGIILVVEDEPALRNLASQILEKQGYKTLVAANGSEALEIWSRRHQDIDLLFTDMVMPDGISGGELARQLGIQKPALKIVYTSGYSPEILEAGGMPEDGSHFLAKPYLPSKMLQTIQKVLHAK